MILLTHQRPSQGDAVTIQMPFTADLSMPPVFLTRNAPPKPLIFQHHASASTR